MRSSDFARAITQEIDRAASDHATTVEPTEDPNLPGMASARWRCSCGARSEYDYLFRRPRSSWPPTTWPPTPVRLTRPEVPDMPISDDGPLYVIVERRHSGRTARDQVYDVHPDTSLEDVAERAAQLQDDAQNRYGRKRDTYRVAELRFTNDRPKPQGDFEDELQPYLDEALKDPAVRAAYEAESGNAPNPTSEAGR